jgi:integrase
MNRVAIPTEVSCESQERKKLLMTRRNSYQKGSVKVHRDTWTLRYRELDHATGKWSKPRVELGKFKDKKDALKAAAPIMAQVNERNNMEPKKLYAELTFKEFIESRWKLYRQSAKHQPSTIENHDSLIKNHLMPFFGKKKLREVQPSDVSKFLALKTDEDTLSNNTMQNLYGLLHLMFEIAAQFDLIEKSPVRPKLHKLPVEKVKKPTLSAAEIRAILALLPNEQERLFALLLAVTGMRIGEALALRWTDFNATKSELSIKHTLYRQKLKKPKTETSVGTVKLDPRIASLFVVHKKQSSFQAKDDFIFCRPDGRPMNPTALRNHLYKAFDGLEIERMSGKFGYHIFRHSAGTILHKKTRDLKLVQETLRHADISTTSDIYVHLDDIVLGEGSRILTDEILGICPPTVPQESRMVS